MAKLSLSWARFLSVRLRTKSRPELRQAPVLERLEDRLHLAGDFRTFDGTGNNLLHSDWGSAGIDLLRWAAAEYADGISEPGGQNRPGPREISNLLAAQSPSTPGNSRGLSSFVFAWGQFLDHDMSQTPTTNPKVAYPISVPSGDPYFDPAGTGTQIISFTRSVYDAATGTNQANPRQQTNALTAWIDGSMIYGSSQATADSLRTFTGGLLRTSDGGLLPTRPGSLSFVAGDTRVNENPQLTAVQTVFLREHNRLAQEIGQRNSALNDEEIFQRARQIVIAEIQAITFNEFLPALLGPFAPKPYRGYNASVNPGISTEFSTAGYRIGHTLVNNEIRFMNDAGQEIRPALPLKDAFLNPSVVWENGIESMLKALANQRAQEFDNQVVDGLRNFLFGAPGAGGLDLASANIQRGRDHGLADYNAVRQAYGLPAIQSFSDISSNEVVQQKLQSLYGSIDNIDLWVGGLAEDRLPGASVGPTFARIIADQFSRLRDGDRYWYQNVFAKKELRQLERTTLAQIIQRNTSIQKLQPNVFFFRSPDQGRGVGRHSAPGHNGSFPATGVRFLNSVGELVEHELIEGHAHPGLNVLPAEVLRTAGGAEARRSSSATQLAAEGSLRYTIVAATSAIRDQRGSSETDFGWPSIEGWQDLIQKP